MSDAPRLVGFAGCSNSGKTTLIERLIGELAARGQRASVIKHAHKGFELDVPGKDSWRHRKAGAHEVLVASPHLLALQRETAAALEYRPEELAAMLQPVDWVLAEGWRHAPIPKIEVWRAASGEAPLYPNDPRIVAVATDDPARLPTPAPDMLDLNQPGAVADWLLRHRNRFATVPHARSV